jgi:hypothetical protein
MYRSPRYLAIKPFVARPLWATVGAAAGCGNATTWVKVYTLQPFLDAAIAIAAVIPPSVRWHADIFIDDLQMDVAADNDDAALAGMDEVAVHFLSMIQDDMHADLAYSKAAIVASSSTERKSEALAKRVRRLLGKAGGQYAVAIPNLGIDFAAGRERGRWMRSKGTVKRERVAKGRRRAKRVAQLRASMPSRKHRAKHLFTGNVRAVAFYGCEVHGLDDKEMLAAWRMAAKCVYPSAPGRSLEALALLSGDLLGSLPFAQVRRWHSEVWRAACSLDPIAYSLADLNRFFAQVSFPAKWSKARGPIAGAALELQRLGWRFDGPFKVVSDLDDTIVLTRHSPAEVTLALRAACKRQLERALAEKWRAASDCGHTKALRLAHEPICKLLRSSKVLPESKAVIKAVACNAIWTRQRLVTTGGLAIDPSCQLCGGMHPDTMWHRLWVCPHADVVELRNTLDLELVARAIRAGPDSLLYGRGWMLHPYDLWPRPCACDDGTDWIRFEVSDLERGRRFEYDEEQWRLHGHVYPDGSCMPHVLSELCRASWASVMVDAEGRFCRAASGAVPSYIRQTAYAAEWCGAAVTAQLADGPTDAAQDCKGVVDEWAKPLHKQLRASSVHAGQANEVLRRPSRSHVAFRWAKGHVLDEVADPLEIVDGDARRDALGNSKADMFANIARDLHPQPEPWLAKKVRQDISDVTAILKYAAKVVVLWPRLDRDELQAAQRVSRPRRATGPRNHHHTGCVWASTGSARPACPRRSPTILRHGERAKRALERLDSSARCWPTPRGTIWPSGTSTAALACCASRAGLGARFARGS